MLKVVAAALLLASLVVFALSVAPKPASADANKYVVLGKNNMKLEPNCGRDFSRDCIVEGKVTGYQALSKKVPGRNFVVPFKGKIVTWSISLARATKKPVTVGPTTFPAQIPAFNDIFGSPSQARISVLREVNKRKKGPPQYKMVRQSPTQILNPYFGSTVEFALSKPLNVNEGQTIGLTIPTWAPVLWKPQSCNVSPFDNPDCNVAEKEYTWRGSRGPKYCELGFEKNGDPNAALTNSHAQSKVNSVKRYGCYYGGNVLLYTATLVGE